MKNSLLKNLFAIIVASALSAVVAHAQIIYTNIPDVTISKAGAKYSLDLNNDGTKDYEFQIHTLSVYARDCKGKKTSYYLTITTLNGNEVFAYAIALPRNSIIDNSCCWNDVGNMEYSSWYCLGGWIQSFGGDWTNGNDKYLGLKLHVASTVYYGWARCSASIDNTGTKLTLTIKDYAYNSIPNQSILAGQTSTAVTPAQKNEATNVVSNNAAEQKEKVNDFVNTLKSYPNPFSNSTNVSFSLTQTEKVSIRIFDIAGRLVKTLANAEMKVGTHQLSWNAKDEKQSKVGSGIYFLKMQLGNYSEIKKLVVEK